ncbi:MAG: amidase [Candidatus Acidiferrum sp.]
MNDDSRVDARRPTRAPADADENVSSAAPQLPARRKFIQTSLLAGASVAVLSPARSSASSLNNSSAREARSLSGSFEFDEMTVTEMQEGMASGRFTAHSITDKYLARIDSIDKHGPALNSVIEVNPDAVSIAKALDKERKQKHVRGPLHGIPVLIKDNIDTADRMMTTAGSLALVGSKPPKDSMLAQKLREAGAVILGKTNLSEWANIRSNQSTSGWSGRGGQTKNPYVLDRNPCGSSSGSGAAVSANLCAIAIGTETDGSIVCPASANGVVGLKPTVGLVSRSGIIPISHSQDTAGPLCRTVKDAAILLGLLTGVDEEDKATSESRGKSYADYTQFLVADGLRGARIGVVRGTFGFNSAVDAVMATALEQLKSQGAVLIDPAEIETRGKFDDSESTVFMYELKADLNAYLARLGPRAPVHTLQEIIEFNEKHREQEMPYFGQELFLKSQLKGPLTSQEYLDALKKNHQLSRVEGIDAVMDKHKLDALVGPTGGPAWLTDLIAGDHFEGGSSTPAAVAGYPNINVPAGYIFGLPVGISFFGRAWSEPVLIRIAYAYEQASKNRKPPQFIPTLGPKP